MDRIQRLISAALLVGTCGAQDRPSGLSLAIQASLAGADRDHVMKLYATVLRADVVRTAQHEHYEAVVRDGRQAGDLRAACLGALIETSNVGDQLMTFLARQIAEGEASGRFWAQCVTALGAAEKRDSRLGDSIAAWIKRKGGDALELDATQIAAILRVGRADVLDGAALGNGLVSMVENAKYDCSALLGVALDLDAPFLARADALGRCSTKLQGEDWTRVRKFVAANRDDYLSATLVLLLSEQGIVLPSEAGSEESSRLKVWSRYQKGGTVTALRKSRIAWHRLVGCTYDEVAVEVRRASAVPVYVGSEVGSFLFRDDLVTGMDASCEEILGICASEAFPLAPSRVVGVWYEDGYVIVDNKETLRSLVKYRSR